MVERTSRSSLLRRILHWLSFQKSCSPVNHGGGFVYNTGRQRRRAFDPKVIFHSELLAGQSPHQHWTPYSLASALPNLESNGLETRTSCRTGRILLRGTFTHASNAAKDGLAYVGIGVCLSHAFCPTVLASKFSLEQWRRDGCDHFVLQQLVKNRAPFDGDPTEQRPPRIQQNSESVNLTLPENGARVLTSHNVVRTLRTQTNGKSALLFFEWAGQQAGYEHSPATFYALVEILGVARELDALKQLMVDAERTNCMTSGVFLATLARAYCQGEMFEAALECVRKMQDRSRLLSSATNSSGFSWK